MWDIYIYLYIYIYIISGSKVLGSVLLPLASCFWQLASSKQPVTSSRDPLNL